MLHSGEVGGDGGGDGSSGGGGGGGGSSSSSSSIGSKPLMKRSKRRLLTLNLLVESFVGLELTVELKNDTTLTGMLEEVRQR